jgi:hypothetical protein
MIRIEQAQRHREKRKNFVPLPLCASLIKVLGKGFKGKPLFQKGFPLKLIALPLKGEGLMWRPYLL